MNLLVCCEILRNCHESHQQRQQFLVEFIDSNAELRNRKIVLSRAKRRLEDRSVLRHVLFPLLFIGRNNLSFLHSYDTQMRIQG